MKQFLNRYQVIIFFTLVFIISWYPWYTGGHGFKTWGVSAAGLIVVAMVSGWQGIKEMFRRLIKARVGFRWWAIALFAPPLITLAAIGIHVLFGGEAPGFVSLRQEPLMILALMVMLLTPFGGAGGEEPFGWRGYAQSKLQEMSGNWAPFITSLIIGIAWGIWHLPEFFNPVSSQYALGIGFIVPFTCMEIANSVIMTWLYNKTGGSVLVAGVTWHLMVDTSSIMILDTPVSALMKGEIPPLDMGIIYIDAALMVLVALVLVLITKGRLGLSANDA